MLEQNMPSSIIPFEELSVVLEQHGFYYYFQKVPSLEALPNTMPLSDRQYVSKRTDELMGGHIGIDEAKELRDLREIIVASDKNRLFTMPIGRRARPEDLYAQHLQANPAHVAFESKYGGNERDLISLQSGAYMQVVLWQPLAKTLGNLKESELAAKIYAKTRPMPAPATVADGILVEMLSNKPQDESNPQSDREIVLRITYGGQIAEILIDAGASAANISTKYAAWMSCSQVTELSFETYCQSYTMIAPEEQRLSYERKYENARLLRQVLVDEYENFIRQEPPRRSERTI